MLELPTLRLVLEPCLQALTLFVFADVQEEFQNHSAALGEHPLEFVDLRVAFSPDLFRNQLMHAHHQHIFVVAAIEDHDLAICRSLRVNSPQIVMIELQLGRLLE